jgi:L-cystine uptake protein TcyP (sodium:dicarboxylate symporter family)
MEKVLTSATFAVCLSGIVLTLGGIFSVPGTARIAAIVWLSVLGLAVLVDLGRVLWWLAKR